MSQRMRKKHNFEERMSACSGWLVRRGAPSVLNMKEAAEKYRDLICFKEVFGRDRPVELEIGAGKGGFMIELALRHPEVNFLALEKMSNVILTPLEEVHARKIENIRFLNIRAELLACYIPENSIDTIYLNFSTPLPKLGYANQRLTHPRFINAYKKLLKDGGKIIQKTDNRDFFDYSLEQYKATGFDIEYVSYNLHENGNPADNIITEYEKKWVERGLPIHKVIAIINKNKS